ncbi:hypothetical protein TNCV_3782081 [Trichonephila clavipes]|nr:hypothetical protein TNCV_3782081 [Trichonephila clavipes]
MCSCVSGRIPNETSVSSTFPEPNPQVLRAEPVNFFTWAPSSQHIQNPLGGSNTSSAPRASFAKHITLAGAPH